MELNVLVVEDNDIFNKILCKKINDLNNALSESGVTLNCFSAKSATEADEVITSNSIDIGVLDYLFDDYSGDRRTGIEMLISLKEKFPNCGVVMISGEHDTDVVQEAKELGASHFISKGNQLMAMGQLDVAVREIITSK